MLIFKAVRHFQGITIMAIALEALLSGQYLVGAVQVAFCAWLSNDL